MSVESDKHGEQNSALLTFLAGTWTTLFTAHARCVLGFPPDTHMDSHFRGATLRGIIKSLPAGGVAAHYAPHDNPASADVSSADSFLRLELNRTDNTLVVYLGNDPSVPGIKGVWSHSGFRFLGDFHDGITLWEVFKAFIPGFTKRPSMVSIIVSRTSEYSWLLDVAFGFKRSHPSQGKSVGLRCRLQFWHFLQRPDSSAHPHPQDVEDCLNKVMRKGVGESFNDVLARCDEVAQNVEFRLDEIDGLIATLEESKAACEDQLRRLEEVRSNAESGKNDTDLVVDDIYDTILKLHENALASADGSVVTEQFEEILARASQEFDDLQENAESLRSEIDFLETDADLTDLLASVWINAEYDRGQQMLREKRDHLPQPDLSFLGSIQPSVRKLSKAAIRIVETTAVLVQLALRESIPEELDYGPQIASMAKACERILDDVFKEKKEAIATDPITSPLLLDEGSCEYRIPGSMSNVHISQLTNVVKMLKKSIDADTAIKWNGMGNKRIALLLFGGWIPVCHASHEYVINPLRVNRSGEFVQILPDRLELFQAYRNGFVHHDLADNDDLHRSWECFQDCLKGLLQGLYSEST